MPLSASSITSTFIPSLPSPDPVEPHVQGGGLHTWSSVGESVYSPCAKSSIRNTVLNSPGYSLYQTLDSRQATLYGSHRMKYVAPSSHLSLGESCLTAEFPRGSTLQNRRRTTKYTIRRTNGTRIMNITGLSTWTNPPLQRRTTLCRSNVKR
jgi:hypothetical protein